MKILKSSIDGSVNFIIDRPIGNLETRYVRRPDKNIIYLSSQTGCIQACRMCHLTAQGQTKLQNAVLKDFVEQAEIVVKYIYDNKLHENQDRLHVNFMSRGEPLANRYIVNHWDELSSELNRITSKISSSPILILSSIFPRSFQNHEILKFAEGKFIPRIYWSAYSANVAFRKQWLPNALSFNEGLHILDKFYHHANVLPRIHFALIEDKNDSVDDMNDMADAINKFDMPIDINIVRYNPFSEKYGRESPRYLECVEQLKKSLIRCNVKVITRVGEDIYASCGTFHPPKMI